MARGGGERCERVRQKADPRAAAVQEDASVWDILDHLRDTAHFWGNVRATAAAWPDPPGGGPRVDTAFAQPEQILELTDAMVRHGWAEADIRGLLGLNRARVAATAWAPR
jgi:microsomal dipeptidase-like Zn-dependent dipeptidase